MKKAQKKFSKIRKLLKDNADAIQKLATVQHKKLIGNDPLPDKHFDKYSKAHIKIIKALASNLDDFEKGTTVFIKLGKELAKDALKDGLTIEEAVDGTIFQKQAIWKKLEEEGILKEISTQDLYEFSQTIGSYCDVLASKIAFTYHHYFNEEVARSEERFRTLTEKRSEERFRALIEKSADAVALINSKGKVEYSSPSTESVTGYTQREFQKLSNPFELAPPDDRKTVTKLFEELLEKPGSSVHATYRIKHKNNKLIWIESTMTNLIDDTNVSAVVINYRDVTERKDHERQKEEFIGIASHELKTPVTSIKGYVQVLQSRFTKEGNTKTVEFLQKMDAQLNKLTSLIGDLLDSTKLEGGRLQFHAGYYDFNELVKDIVDEMQQTTTKHTLVKKLTPTKTVNGDRDRIGQVITNLISNAIKYSPHSKEIIITTLTEENNITLSVKDFGHGIALAKQEKIFDRFFRVSGNNQDTFAGLGLGLYISAEIVKRHGGRIWVESKEHDGATFSFTLPIKKSGVIIQQTNSLVEEEIKHE